MFKKEQLPHILNGILFVALLATEPVVKAEAYKSAIAVATVVIFGTTAMFLYPLLYKSGI